MPAAQEKKCTTTVTHSTFRMEARNRDFPTPNVVRSPGVAGQRRRRTTARALKILADRGSRSFSPAHGRRAILTAPRAAQQRKDTLSRLLTLHLGWKRATVISPPRMWSVLPALLGSAAAARLRGL